MKLWLEVDGIQAPVSLPATLRDEMEEALAHHKLNTILPKVPIAGRLAADVEAAMLRGCEEPATDGPQLTAILFGKGSSERLVVYLLDRDPAAVLSSMQSQGWQVLGRRDAPMPFAACKRIVVYHRDELMKAQT